MGLIDTHSGFMHFNFFALLRLHLEVARMLAGVGLLVVISGWRPRFTGILHWWIAWSLSSTIVPADGGDQVAAVVTMILIPLTLTDPRRWHWQPAPTLNSVARIATSRIALSSIVIARLQAAAIYFHAAIGKIDVPEWLNGTAMFYWLLAPRVGLPTTYRSAILSFFQPSFTVALLTWGPMALELALCLVLTMSDDHVLRKLLFALGLFFHFGTILLFGLVSFFCSMACMLVLLCRPSDRPFHLERLVALSNRVRNRSAGLLEARAGAGRSVRP